MIAWFSEEREYNFDENGDRNQRSLSNFYALEEKRESLEQEPSRWLWYIARTAQAPQTD